MEDNTSKTMTQPGKLKRMRTITLEEHFATPAFMEGPGRHLKERAQAVNATPQVIAEVAKLIERLCDIGDGRIAEMDAAGIDVQALSLTSPGVEHLDVGRGCWLCAGEYGDDGGVGPDADVDRKPHV